MNVIPALEFSPINLASVPFVHFCQLLEGIPWSDIEKKIVLKNETNENKDVNLMLLEKELCDRQLFLFVDETGTPPPLEVLWLKWRIFVGLCERIVELHRDHQAPFLALKPETIKVWMSPYLDTVTPFLWNFHVGLDNNFSPSIQNLSDISDSLSSQIFLSSFSEKSLFQSPEQQYCSSVHKQGMTVVLLSLDQLSGEGTNPDEIEAKVKIYLPSEDFPCDNISSKDIFEITLGQEGEQEGPLVHLWASKIEVQERGLVLSGKTRPIPVAQWKQWESSGRKIFPNSSVQIHGGFHVPSDIYSLGILLLSLLVGPHTANFSRLEAAIPTIVDKLNRLESKEWEKDWNGCMRIFKGWCNQEENLFLRPETKRETIEIPSRTLSIPLGIWDRIILLGFRLIARVPNFGFCESRDAYDPLQPHGVMENVVTEVREIGMQLSKELFGFPRRNLEIHRACEIIRKEINGDFEPINGL